MPIIDRENDIFPDDLLDHEGNESQQRRWSAVHTKARQEKALARQLFSYQIPFFLPLVPKDNLIRGRRVRSYAPLFSGYLFLHCSPEERVQTMTTNRVAHILPVEEETTLVTDLRQIRNLIAVNAPMTVERRLGPGRRVRVKKGALKGLEGIIEERRSSNRLVVAVNYLQQGVSVEIDDFMVEPL